MSAVKRLYPPRDPCASCDGTGEIITPTPFPTNNPHYAGWAYDEHLEMCPACEGTGNDLTSQDGSLEDAAAWHALITQTKEVVA